MSLVILSKSSIKIEAIREWNKNNFEIKSYEMPNITPMQPLNENGLECAKLRTKYYLEKHPENTNIVLAIENFIDTSKCEDKCAIVITYRQKSIHAISSDDIEYEPVFFDKKYLDMLKDPNTETVGKFIANDYNCLHDDWFKFVENNRIDRKQQIISTLKLLEKKFSEFMLMFAPMYNNYPKIGVKFRDVLPIFSDINLTTMLDIVFYNKMKHIDVEFDYVVGLESRGFIVGAYLAKFLKCGFVPIRKEGKLPSDKIKMEYVKEYGKDTFEISKDAMKKNANVIIVDDILATGGSLMASYKLVKTFNPCNVYGLILLDIQPLKKIAEETLGDFYKKVIILST